MNSTCCRSWCFRYYHVIWNIRHCIRCSCWSWNSLINPQFKCCQKILLELKQLVTSTTMFSLKFLLSYILKPQISSIRVSKQDITLHYQNSIFFSMRNFQISVRRIIFSCPFFISAHTVPSILLPQFHYYQVPTDTQNFVYGQEKICSFCWAEPAYTGKKNAKHTHCNILPFFLKHS